MNFSRMHMGLLGVVSLFTGMIAPVVQNTSTALPFPLTDLQIPAYIILILLAIICILLTVRYWLWVRFFGLLIIMIIGYLFVISWNGDVHSLTGSSLWSISWGWLFICIGLWLIIGCMFPNEEENKNIHASISDHMIWWLSAITILALTGLIISISYISRQEYSNNKNILKTIFWSWWIESHSEVVMSNPYQSINNLTFDRKYDSINFYTSSWSKMISIPDGTSYDRLPYGKIIIWDIWYTISADGSITSSKWTYIGKAILPQKIEKVVLAQSGSVTFILSNKWIHNYSWYHTDISDIISTNWWEHIIWKEKSGSWDSIYKDGILSSIDKNSISNISVSTDWVNIMYLSKEIDGLSYIIKNWNKIEKIEKWYIEGSLKMNGNNSIYTIEHDGNIEIIYNGKLLDRKFDEVREIFIVKDSDGFVYFGRPLWEKTYCLYTSYRGNLCWLTGYMNPRISPDGTSVIYAGLKDDVWWIYRNATPIIRNTWYPNREDISQDYVFFDITNPSYYLFIRHMDTWYTLYTKWKWISRIWKDVWLDATFGYDNKIIMSAQDEKWWRILEF